MANSYIPVTTGSGLFVATYSASEDGKTKELQRIILSKSDGTEIGTSTNPVGTSGSVVLIGISAMTGNVTISGVSGVTGNVFIVNAITGNVAASVTGSVAIANAITGNVAASVTGSVAIANAITGNVSLVGTSAVTGSVILIGVSGVTGNVTLSGVSGVTGNVSIVGAITGNVAASVTGSVAIANAITGNVAICNAITGNVAASVTGSVAIAGSVTGNFTDTFLSYESKVSKVVYATASSGDIATPTATYRINLTDIIVSATSAGTVYLYDNVDTATSCVTATMSLAIQGGAVINFNKPYVSAVTNNVLKYVASAGAGGSIMVQYYETK